MRCALIGLTCATGTTMVIEATDARTLVQGVHCILTTYGAHGQNALLQQVTAQSKQNECKTASCFAVTPV